MYSLIIIKIIHENITFLHFSALHSDWKKMSSSDFERAMNNILGLSVETRLIRNKYDFFNYMLI